MGGGASASRRSSLPGTTQEVAARLDLRTDQHDENETVRDAEDGTPRSTSLRLNRAMTEALQQSDYEACAALGGQMVDIPGVPWGSVSEADDGDHRILSAVEKPNRAVLAAVCNSKAVSLKGIGRVNDVKYYQELARMFASSLGPAGTASKATVDAAAHAMQLQLQLRHSPCSRQQSGRRRQSSSF
jgi:hypothetical protein